MKNETAITPRMKSVRAAFFACGWRNALTPFEIASTPVSAAEPEANARSRTKMVTAPAPDDVMTLITGLLAEVAAVKAKLGLTTSTTFPKREELNGRTPQWCFFYLGQSIALLDEISGKEASN